MELTPKEKAKELYNLHKSYLPSGIEPNLFKALAKQFSLICANETLNVLYNDDINDYSTDIKYYLQEVIQELETF